jgi:hypothetical protein
MIDLCFHSVRCCSFILCIGTCSCHIGWHDLRKQHSSLFLAIFILLMCNKLQTMNSHSCASIMTILSVRETISHTIRQVSLTHDEYRSRMSLSAC